MGRDAVDDLATADGVEEHPVVERAERDEVEPEELYARRHVQLSRRGGAQQARALGPTEGATTGVVSKDVVVDIAEPRADGGGSNASSPGLRLATAVSVRSCFACAPFTAPWGEQVHELCGLACPREVDVGLGHHSAKQSLAKICFAPGVYSRRHFHPEPTEEVFYVLAGVGEVEVGGATATIKVGDTVVIPSRTPHQIGNSPDSRETLEVMVVCVPAWQPSNTTWLDAATQVVGTPDEAQPWVEI